ncbi:hypothetical protein EOPP23_01480 [Endozoicomonas sp. OPT23]|uniref:hypothetical protein n=1 Tax=Endozoicomonas sp. OPT23 TaxID=2072845 RepID=UPI00129AF07F|nr:hypothetical protein [Endozoicomonas sp. OPT23]MRI31665.1 hypothetical protein [Endozoicomonas sp. OPT23]
MKVIKHFLSSEPLTAKYVASGAMIAAMALTSCVIASDTDQTPCQRVFNDPGAQTYLVGFTPETEDYFSATLTSGNLTQTPLQILNFQNGTMYYHSATDDTCSELDLDTDDSECMTQMTVMDDLKLNWVGKFDKNQKETTYGISTGLPVLDHLFLGYEKKIDKELITVFAAVPKPVKCGGSFQQALQNALKGTSLNELTKFCTNSKVEDRNRCIDSLSKLKQLPKPRL